MERWERLGLVAKAGVVLWGCIVSLSAILRGCMVSLSIILGGWGDFRWWWLSPGGEPGLFREGEEEGPGRLLQCVGCLVRREGLMRPGGGNAVRVGGSMSVGRLRICLMLCPFVW